MAAEGASGKTALRGFLASDISAGGAFAPANFLVRAADFFYSKNTSGGASALHRQYGVWGLIAFLSAAVDFTRIRAQSFWSYGSADCPIRIF